MRLKYQNVKRKERAEYCPINLDNIYSADIVDDWIEEREDAVLDNRENEWLDEDLVLPVDEDDETQAEPDPPRQSQCQSHRQSHRRSVQTIHEDDETQIESDPVLNRPKHSQIDRVYEKLKHTSRLGPSIPQPVAPPNQSTSLAPSEQRHQSTPTPSECTHGASLPDTGHSLSSSGSHTTDGTGGGVALAALVDSTLFVARDTDVYYNEDIPIPYRDVYRRDYQGGGDVTGERGGGQGRHHHDLSGMPVYAGDQGYITTSFGDFGLGDSQSQTYGGDFGFGDSQSQNYGGSS